MNVPTSLEFKCANYHIDSLELQYAYHFIHSNSNVNMIISIGNCLQIELYVFFLGQRVHVRVRNVLCALKFQMGMVIGISACFQCHEFQMCIFIGISQQICKFIGISVEHSRGLWD